MHKVHKPSLKGFKVDPKAWQVKDIFFVVSTSRAPPLKLLYNVAKFQFSTALLLCRISEKWELDHRKRRGPPAKMSRILQASALLLFDFISFPFSFFILLYCFFISGVYMFHSFYGKLAWIYTTLILLLAWRIGNHFCELSRNFLQGFAFL